MTTIEEGNERLLKLADQLENIPEWQYIRTERGTYRRGYYQETILHPCGSPACAWGHYFVLNPERQQSIMANRCGGWVREIPVSDPDTGASYTLKFCSIEAAAYEFALDDFEVNRLFQTDGCGGAKTGREAAAYIRKFVERRRSEPAPELFEVFPS